MPDTDVKYFTPSEAKRTLPLVKKIVRDILDNAFQIRTIIDSLTESLEFNDEVKRLSDEVNHYLKELHEIGCSYKDWNFSVGLVDFPSVIEGKEVLLCWRSDEQDILYYHGIDEGYAGRKLIPEEYL